MYCGVYLAEMSEEIFGKSTKIGFEDVDDALELIRTAFNYNSVLIMNNGSKEGKANEGLLQKLQVQTGLDKI